MIARVKPVDAKLDEGVRLIVAIYEWDDGTKEMMTVRGLNDTYPYPVSTTGLRRVP